MNLRSFTIHDMFSRNARLFADATAVVTADGARISHQELARQVDALAVGLASRGVVKGDRVAILALNHEGFFPLIGAAAALGAVLVPVNWRLSADEIRTILADSEPKLIVADSAHLEAAGDLAPSATGRIAFTSDGGGIEGLTDLYADGPAPLAPVEGDDPFCIIYTAAVEGVPRGAVLSHANFISANVQVVAHLGLSPADGYLNMLPLFHITGLNLALATLHVGGKNVVAEKFDETAALEIIESEKISLMGSFPPMLSRLVSAMETSKRDLSTLRVVMGLDGPEPIAALESRTDARFWILYGQTETGGFVTLGPASDRPGTAGAQGLLSKMRLVDDSDADVPDGEAGEIVVQGPLVFSGYWGQDELNRRTFRNGWHHTGDLGKLDSAGHLIFAGRKPEKELIKPGGENVYPAEVEAVILQCPDVAEVSVIGVPDPRFGEGIKAVCVLKPGASLPPEDLMEFVASRIARYKKPRYVEFVEALPKTADGAVDRAAVKARHGQ